MESTIWAAGWDGEWFRRAYDAYGKPVGSKKCAEGKIFIDADPVGVWTADEQILMGKNNYHCEHWEVSLTKINKIRRPAVYSKIGQFPPVKRDLALWVPKDLEFERLFDSIRMASPLIAGVEPFDLYEKDGRQSLALHLLFQTPDRTLAAPEVELAVKSIIEFLTKSLNVSIRI